MSLGLVWKMSDALNGMMAIPNLIALLLLSPVVFKLTRQYYQQSADNTVENKS
jgi:AGCS family alanine or glycine:cation symporter